MGPTGAPRARNRASRIRRSTPGNSTRSANPLLMLSNADVAKKLLEIRTLMELAGESFYKYSAFEKAATTVENAAPLPEVIAAGELLKLPGIGKSIGAVVEQLVQ